MRILFSGILYLFCAPLFAQFTDSFSDGDAENNPAWIYHSGDFEVAGERLHSNQALTSSNRYAISAGLSSNNYSFFSFDLELQLNPSGSNFVDAWVSADSLCDVAGSGYFIRIGDTKDNICLYEWKNGTKRLLIYGKEGALNKSSSFLTIRIFRQPDGRVRLYRLDHLDGTWVTEGISTEPIQFLGAWMGFCIQQYGTGAIGKHYIDNVYFGHQKDTSGPLLMKVNPSVDGSVCLQFDEPLASFDSSKIVLDGSMKPMKAVINPLDERIIQIQFPVTFQWNQQYHISVSGTQNFFGHAQKPAIRDFIIYRKDTAHFGDLVFTEVMANPSPGLGFFPEAEYLEIWNRSARHIDLGGCLLKDAVSQVSFPDSIIRAGERVVVSKNSFGGFATPGVKWIGMSSFPSLNNDKDQLFMYNQRGELVTTLSYDENWHSEAWKKSGGWSLERKDTMYFCVDEGNWVSAKKNGGSPGKTNSGAGGLKLNSPELRRIYTIDDHTLRLYFNQPLDEFEALSLTHFDIDETGQHPLHADFVNGSHATLELSFPGAWNANEVMHLSFSGLKTCDGRALSDQLMLFGLAESKMDSGSVQINEVLFNPKGAGSDFVELVNVTDRILDLKNIRLANADDLGQIDQITTITAEGYDLLPGEFVVLCLNEENIKVSFLGGDERRYYTMASMPSYPNDKGHVLVVNQNGNVIDGMLYSESMHSPVLTDVEGVSLEKYRPKEASGIASNWTSAAASSGYGTPGRKNSQYIEKSEGRNYFQLKDEWISPDDDGDHDVAVIHYKLSSPGYFVKAVVFSESGEAVAKPFDNFSVSSEGDLFWDGTHGGTLLPSGNYVILLEAYHPEGKVIREKITFSLLKRI